MSQHIEYENDDDDGDFPMDMNPDDMEMMEEDIPIVHEDEDGKDDPFVPAQRTIKDLRKYDE
jgi:hypothetical protein